MFQWKLDKKYSLVAKSWTRQKKNVISVFCFTWDDEKLLEELELFVSDDEYDFNFCYKRKTTERRWAKMKRIEAMMVEEKLSKIYKLQNMND